MADNANNSEVELFSDSDDEEIPGPSNMQILANDRNAATTYRTTSPELFTDDGEPLDLDDNQQTPIDKGKSTVDEQPGCSKDAVVTRMDIDQAFDELCTSGAAAEAEQALIQRWLTEGAEREGLGGGRRGAAVGWMMEGRGDERGQLRSFGHYMRLKKDKLHHQVNVLGRPKQVSEIFKGVSIFVNGYTEPPALELRALIQAHGGEYHVYYEYGTTTYTIASEMANVKRSKARKNEVIIRPEFIVDSVASGRRLDHKPYLLLPDEDELMRRRGGTISQAMKKLTEKAAEASGTTKQVALDARDAAFIDEYYARSRLHLISTLAQEMRDYVSSLRDANASTEAARAEMNERLRGGSQMDNTTRSSSSNLPLPPSEKAILHVDLDCFFVSVTLRNRPELKGKPVAVTHSSGSKDANGFSEIASCSYEARARGVKNGSLVRDALRNCSNLVCVPYQFEDYRSVSKMIYDVMARHTLELRAVSCDEMYVDATSLIRSLDGNGSADGASDHCPPIGPVAVANYLRAEIRNLTGCPASVGIGPSPLIARLSTRHAKPDGVKWVQKEQVDHFVGEQKISDLPGVGYSTLQKLEQLGGNSMKCYDLRRFEEKELEEVVGKKTANMIYRMIRGIDETEVVVERVRKSVSCDINYGIRFTKEEELHQFLSSLASQLEKKLLQARMKAGALTLKVMVRAADAPVETAKYLGHGRCDTHTRCGRLEPPCGDAEKLLTEARKLMRSIKSPVQELRGIGIQLGRLVPSNSATRPLASQLNRFFAPKKGGERIEGEKKRVEEKKKGGAKRGRELRYDKWGDEIEDHRRQMKDFMVQDIQIPTRLHIPPSKLQKLDWKAPKRLTFMGEFIMPKIKVKILEMMIEPPSPSSIGPLLLHGWSLSQRGELNTLREFARATMMAAESSCVADGWLFTARSIGREWETACCRRFQAFPDLIGRQSRNEMNEVIDGNWKEIEEEKEDNGIEE